jgi:hypothetical protein
MLPFQGSHLRISRADEHRVAFSHRWDAFTERKFYSIVIEEHGDRAGGEVRIVRREPFDVTGFSLDIGEMLYQLRAALDGAVYDAAVVVSGSSPPPGADKLQLPIGKDAASFTELGRSLPPTTHESTAGLHRVDTAVQRQIRRRHS